MINPALLSSKRTTYATPWDFFLKLDAEFHFTLDPCAQPETAKCAKFFTEEQDGLSRDWSGDIVFMNPPYGREIGLWMKKAVEESLKGATVVCLVPSRTDTAWWHNYAVRGDIRFLRGRITFEGERYSAPFPCAIVIFDANKL